MLSLRKPHLRATISGFNTACGPLWVADGCCAAGTYSEIQVWFTLGSSRASESSPRFSKKTKKTLYGNLFQMFGPFPGNGISFIYILMAVTSQRPVLNAKKGQEMKTSKAFKTYRSILWISRSPKPHVLHIPVTNKIFLWVVNKSW